MSKRAVVRLVAVLALLPAPALAQQRQGLPREQMEERIRQRFGEQVRRELGLSEQQLAEVQQVEASFQEQRRALVRREGETRRQLRRDGGRTDAQARTLLEEMAAVRADEARLFRAEMDALLDTLSADQVLRFYELRNDLMERVRRLRQGANPGGPPGGPRGGLRGVALTTPHDLG